MAMNRNSGSQIQPRASLTPAEPTRCKCLAWEASNVNVQIGQAVSCRVDGILLTTMICSAHHILVVMFWVEILEQDLQGLRVILRGEDMANLAASRVKDFFQHGHGDVQAGAISPNLDGWSRLTAVTIRWHATITMTATGLIAVEQPTANRTLHGTNGDEAGSP